MSDNKDTQNDDVEFSQDELDELKKQGIDDAELEKLVKTVNDELSDNANEKDNEKDDDKGIKTEKETDNKDINQDTQNDDKENGIVAPINTTTNIVNADNSTKQNDHNNLANIHKANQINKSSNSNNTKQDDNQDNKGNLKDNLANKSINHSADNPPNKDDNLQGNDLNNDNPKNDNSTNTNKDQDKDKDTQKTEQQQADIVRTLIAKKHSQKTIDHKEVRINIEAGALPPKMFFIMNGLSAVIAGYGLLANSPAVVIGAMLVAMMLSPITSAALAVIDARLSLLKTSLITLIGGVLVIYAIGMGLGFLHGDNVMTGEILARTSPTTMDLMVALAGGAAGAYAMVSPNLSVAVVGVAVATALVPPLAASGILLASGHLSLAWGAFLLALTNMLAIQFTNALVLWFAGFRRTLDDDDVGKLGQIGLFLKRNSAVLIALIVIGGYLSVNFGKTLNEQKFERQSIALVEQSIQNQANYLVSHSFTHEEKNTHTLRVVIQGLITPSQAQAIELEQQIQALAKDTLDDRVIKLQIRFVPEVVIQSAPADESELKLSPDDIKNLQKVAKN